VQHGSAKTAVSVDVRGGDKEVVLRVHNRSPVIPAADLPGIFGPFKRLKSGAGAGGASSSLGLGLYIAERIVTAHGGTIVAESSNDFGTSFTVRLPRSAEQTLLSGRKPHQRGARVRTGS
jgi:signal transduction histidine kinase